MDNEIEQAIIKLVHLCKEKNYVLTGILSHTDAGLVGFDSDQNNSEFNEEVNTIRTLIKTKGNIEEFLMELSHVDSPFYDSNDDRTTMYTATNPQILNTTH